MDSSAHGQLVRGCERTFILSELTFCFNFNGLRPTSIVAANGSAAANTVNNFMVGMLADDTAMDKHTERSDEVGGRRENGAPAIMT